MTKNIYSKDNDKIIINLNIMGEELNNSKNNQKQINNDNHESLNVNIYNEQIENGYKRLLIKKIFKTLVRI